MLYVSLPFFLISLLAIFRAPAKWFWFAALGATEWGHLFALISLAIAIGGWTLTRRWGLSSWLALAAAVLFITPLIRAERVARGLPARLKSRFGDVQPNQNAVASARLVPLSIKDLFFGVSSPPVRVTTHQFAITDGQHLMLDLFQPEHSEKPLPAIVVVHGGSWKSGDRREFSELNHYLAARGFIVASIDYRLAPAAIFPAQVDDVFAAIEYLKLHAQELGVDKNNFILLGRSAGGQIALSAAYAQKDPAIKGVVAFYAPNDLAWGYSIPGNPLIMNSQKVIETYLGGTPAALAGVYEAASPINFVNKTTPPTLMIHGVRDELVWAKHEERLSPRLEASGRPYFYLRLPWATHGCDANFRGPSGQISTYTVERFLAAVETGRFNHD